MDLNFIINSSAYSEYIAASKLITKTIRTTDPDTSSHYDRYRRAVAVYRNLLDDCGFKMHQPIYRYDPKDKRTWRYLDVSLSVDDYGKKRFVRNIENPDFIFST